MELKIKLDLKKQPIYKIPGLDITLSEESPETALKFEDDNYELLGYLVRGLQDDLLICTDKDASKRVVKLTELYVKLGEQIKKKTTELEKNFKYKIKLGFGRAVWGTTDGTVNFSTIGGNHVQEIEFNKISKRAKEEIKNAIELKVLELAEPGDINILTNFDLDEFNDLAGRSTEKMYNIISEYSYPEFKELIEDAKFKEPELQKIKKILTGIEGREEHLRLLERELKKA